MLDFLEIVNMIVLLNHLHNTKEQEPSFQGQSRILNIMLSLESYRVEVA